MDFKARLANNEDKQRVIELFDRQYVEHPFRNYIDRYFDNDPAISIHVAEINGLVISAGVCEFINSNIGLEIHGVIGVVDRAYRLKGALKTMRKFYMSQAEEMKAVRIYRKHQKNAPHINVEREIANGWTITDAGNNENLIEKFF